MEIFTNEYLFLALGLNGVLTALFPILPLGYWSKTKWIYAIGLYVMGASELFVAGASFYILWEQKQDLLWGILLVALEFLLLRFLVKLGSKKFVTPAATPTVTPAAIPAPTAPGTTPTAPATLASANRKTVEQWAIRILMSLFILILVLGALGVQYGGRVVLDPIALVVGSLITRGIFQVQIGYFIILIAVCGILLLARKVPEN